MHTQGNRLTGLYRKSGATARASSVRTEGFAARRLVFRFALCVGALSAAMPSAQDRVRVRPITAPRAIPQDNALIYTEQNDLDPQRGGVCTSAGRVFYLREVSDSGWQKGPTAAGLSLDIPAGLTLDAEGRLYIADRENHRLVRMDDIAGNGWLALTGAGGDRLSNPATRTTCVSSNHGTYSVVLDLAGRIYIADNQGHRLIRIDDISGRGRVEFGSHGNGVSRFNQLFPGAGEFDVTLEVEATGGLLTGVGLRYDNPDRTVFTTTPVFLLP